MTRESGHDTRTVLVTDHAWLSLDIERELLARDLDPVSWIRCVRVRRLVWFGC